MLYIHTGREDRNKSKYLYEHIEGKTIVLVPDQFTVQAEREAFFYREQRGLIDLEILGFSRLVDRIYHEAGGGRTPMIDRQGRHIILTRILMREREQLTIYGKYGQSQTFVEQVNDFIAEMKQNGRTPEELAALAKSLPTHRYLQGKLMDMARVFQAYEEEIRDRYVDTEDRLRQAIPRMEKAACVRDNVFWIYGFDSFTPKNQEMIGHLAKLASAVHIVLTWDEGGEDEELFSMTDRIGNDLTAAAREAGIEVRREKIGEEYRREIPPAIAAIEKNLFALPPQSTRATQGLTLVQAAGYYSEAESAAAYIRTMVREKGYRYSDIAVICNDLTTRGTILRRIFAQYHIPVFVDEKRSILSQPAVEYVICLLRILSGGYGAEDVIRLLKTGLTDLDEDQVERMENYITTYHVYGKAFQSPFQRGEDSMTKEEWAKLESCRREFTNMLEGFFQAYRQSETVVQKVSALYAHLAETAGLPERIQIQIDRSMKQKDPEKAQELAQVWNVIVSVMDQMVEVTGQEDISQREFSSMLQAGLEAVEIGVIPPTLDGVLMGTMQRTRTGNVRALLVVGANEGVLPADMATEGILSEEEKLELAETEGEDRSLGKLEKWRIREEELAIYRNITRPTEELWISYAASDVDGKSIRPSQILQTIRAICPNVPLQRDLITREDAIEMLSSPEAGAEHLTAALREATTDGELDDWWREGILWYEKKQPKVMTAIEQGMFFTNRLEALPGEEASALYHMEEGLSLSPSRLEKFARCPFAHLVSYGLAPDEPREYQVDPADMGDVYHRCLMKLAQRLTRENTPITAVDSPWMTTDQSQCSKIVQEILAEEFAEYREGIFASGPKEQYRGKRAQEICADAGWRMVSQVRRGSIEAMEQEVAFGRGCPIKPIQVETQRGSVYIEGIVDRVDHLPGEYVKVIDYKSGADQYSQSQALAGWKLQLFVYLRAACEGRRKPAGAFYFHIATPEADVSGVGDTATTETVEKEITKAFRMDGFVVKETAVIENIDGEMQEDSPVIPVQRKKDGEVTSRKKRRLLSPEEMDDLLQAVNDGIDKLCRDLANGEIAIRPARTTSMSACRYCSFKGICKFDASLEGCRYREIRSEA